MFDMRSFMSHYTLLACVFVLLLLNIAVLMANIRDRRRESRTRRLLSRLEDRVRSLESTSERHSLSIYGSVPERSNGGPPIDYER